MSYRQPSPPSITRALSHCADAARFAFGEDTALVAVQHMLLQSVDLFQTVCDLGLPPQNIFAAGKVYSNSLPVIRTLRDMGVTVIESSMPRPGEYNCYFQRDLDRLWKIATHSLAPRRIKRVLVLDDGGMCIAGVPADVLRRYDVCGVEQTSQGVSLFESKPPPCAVFSWARTAVKLQLGGAVFSHCFIDKLNNEFLHGQSLEGTQLGIIGLGSIGKGVANLAGRQKAQVLFYDPDPDLHLPRHLRPITRVSSLEELMVRCDYVVGCSGRNPFENKWPIQYKPGLKLLSCSGGDQEFGPIIRDLKTRSGFEVDAHSLDVTCDGPSGPIHIAYMGFPYTFVSRASEAVDTKVVQLETGGLLAGLIEAHLYIQLCETGLRRTRRIHRLSIAAQRFVYKRWREAMNRDGINISQFYGYDPAILRAAQHQSWFIRNTQPHPEDSYQPLIRLETMMDELVNGRRVMNTFTQRVIDAPGRTDGAQNHLPR